MHYENTHHVTWITRENSTSLKSVGSNSIVLYPPSTLEKVGDNCIAINVPEGIRELKDNTTYVVHGFLDEGILRPITLGDESPPFGEKRVYDAQGNLVTA